MNYQEVIEVGNYALEKGADAVMVISPYYFPLNDSAVEEFYDKIAPEIKGNIMIYNYPDLTGYNVSPEVILHLARKYKNIIGLKDTTVSMVHTRETLKKLRPEFPDFEIYSAFDENFVHNVISGGNGCVGGISHIVPELATDFLNAVRNKNIEKIIEDQRLIDQWMDFYSIGHFSSMAKKAIQIRGIDINDTSTVPLQPATVEQEEKIKSLFNKMNIK